MKQEQLNAIKERVAKATSGPWLVEESRYEGRFNAASADENYDLPACLMGIEDAEFVTHAREDVPALVAEVERLSEELTQSNIERMSLVVDKAYEKSQKNEYIKTINLVNEENRRLREALKFYANNSNYLIEWSDKCDEYMSSVADNDGGEIARQALGGEAHE
ncbi:hypothetical protein VYF65_004326 [Lysinibacillus irui]|uniref:hypothetical protein n=1 Tax=Lysinibacillus irui TaxID=2998077 RepID=UPI00388AC17B